MVNAILTGIAIYDPLRLSEKDFLVGFVARHDLLGLILNQLRKIKPGAEVQKHHLLVGQRGMGKTSLLRRIGLEIDNDEQLSAHLIPLAFREEQYDVRDLGRLWRNCIDALADRLEAQGQHEFADELDQMIVSADWTDANAAYECFEEAVERVGKRPVLLLDNADMILETIGEDEQWSLRGALQERGGPVLIAASIKHMEMSTDPDAAFYEFFRIHVLEPLGARELTMCLRRLARSRGEKGLHVLKVIDDEPQRIHALHSLTGGNPRTLALIYQLLESEETDEVFSDLEHLFDMFTPLYKARVEELSGQQRAVFDAIALNWDPISISKLEEITGLPSTSLSPQLNRLRKNGLIIESKSSRAHKNYLLVERFYNIWYLMRHGTRRGRRRVKWLTAFLTSYYAPEERAILAERLLRRTSFEMSSHPYLFAVSETLDDDTLKLALMQKISEEILTGSRTRQAVSRIVKLEEVNPIILKRSEMREKCFSYNKIGDVEAKVFWNALLGIIELSWEDKSAILEKIPAMTSEDIKKLIKIAEREKFLHQRVIGKTAYNDLCEALRKHHMTDGSDLNGALAVAKRIGRPHVALATASPIHGGGKSGFSASDRRRAITLAEELTSTHTSETLYLIGRVERDIDSIDQAESLFRRAVEIDASCVPAWVHLGVLLARHLEQYEEAEAAYRRAIEIDPENAWAWSHLGELLMHHLERYEEAEAA